MRKIFLLLLFCITQCLVFAQLPTGYCNVSTNVSYYVNINKVSVGSIDKTTGRQTYLGYEDFSNLSTNVTTGSTVTLTIGTGAPGSPDVVVDYFRTVFIDFNRNGSFEDSERITVPTMIAKDNYSLNEVSVTFQIPLTTSFGPTKMRVILSSEPIAGPCGTINAYGKIEDYTINTVCGTLPNPVVPDVEFCGTNPVINITSPNSGFRYQWYTSTGQLLYTGSSFNPTISATTSYYVQAQHIASGCTSTRTLVTARKAALLKPSAQDVTFCGSTPVVLNVTNPDPGQTYRWYTTATGGTLLYTGTSYRPSITSTTTFYLQAENTASGCISDRVAVKATRNDIGLQSPVIPNVTTCGKVATLGVSNPDPTLTYRWYASTTSGVVLNTGATFSPSISGTTTYYVVAQNQSGCRSNYVGVTVTKNDLPSPSAVVNSYCSSQGFFSIISPNPEYQYKWFYDATIERPFAEGTSVNLTTGPVPVVRTYYIEATDRFGCTSKRVPFVAIPHPTILPIIADALICAYEGVATFEISNPQDYRYIWYNAVGQQVGTGTRVSIAATKSTTLSVITINKACSPQTNVNLIVKPASSCCFDSNFTVTTSGVNSVLTVGVTNKLSNPMDITVALSNTPDQGLSTTNPTRRVVMTANGYESLTFEGIFPVNYYVTYNQWITITDNITGCTLTYKIPTTPTTTLGFDLKVKLYPNPFSTSFTFENTLYKSGTYVVEDINRKVYASGSFGPKEFKTINLSGAPAGTYSVRVSIESVTQVYKIMKN